MAVRGLLRIAIITRGLKKEPDAPRFIPTRMLSVPNLMTSSPLLKFAIFIAGCLIPFFAAADQAQYSHGDPSALEQQSLELINRARMNPAQEGVILNAVNTWYSVDARLRKP